MKSILNRTAIIIPIRMGSTRLPGKFHEKIGPKEMVLHVYDRAIETGIKEIWVACDHEEHYNLIKNYGGNVIMTSKDHPRGTDRVHEALNKIDPENKIEYIINLQADVPFINSEYIIQSLIPLSRKNIDIGTLAAVIDDESAITKPNIVKIALNNDLQAIYFSRSVIPYGSKTYYHHVGIYSFTREALNKFVSLPQAYLEQTEQLEQLRALENNMKIGVNLINDIPITVDIPEDLAAAREYFASYQNPKSL